MATAKVPPGDAAEELRVIPEEVWYDLWFSPAFPLALMGGKLDKDYAGTQKWIMGLLADIRSEGRWRNPVIVWNHHPLRGKKQPRWLVRAGSNRVWCAEQLGWTAGPVVFSVDPNDRDAENDLARHAVQRIRLAARDVQSLFVDGGNIWANKHGFGLLRAKKPELTYGDYVASPDDLALIRPTAHQRTVMPNPLVEDQ